MALKACLFLHNFFIEVWVQKEANKHQRVTTPHCSSSPESYNQEIIQVIVIKNQLKTVGLSGTGCMRGDLKQDGRSKKQFCWPWVRSGRKGCLSVMVSSP